MKLTESMIKSTKKDESGKNNYINNYLNEQEKEIKLYGKSKLYTGN